MITTAGAETAIGRPFLPLFGYQCSETMEITVLSGSSKTFRKGDGHV
jgi:hypothetical protein